MTFADGRPCFTKLSDIDKYTVLTIMYQKRGVYVKTGGVGIRLICKSLICFLLGRVYIMNVNPVAVAALLIAGTDRERQRIYSISVVLGILSGLIPGSGINGGSVIKYLLISMCILAIGRLAGKRGIKPERKMIVPVGAVVTFLIDIGGGITEPGPAFIIAGAEAAGIIILANLMYRGMEWLDYGKPGCYMNGEQMISVIMCMTLAAAGVPDILPDLLMISGMVYNIFLLYMSYQYGIAAGAMTGAAIGIEMGIAEGNIAIAGMYCMVGICVGVVHEFGRLACIMMWGLAGSVVAMLYPDILWNVDMLKVLLSTSVLFLMLPKRLFVEAVSDDGAEVTAVRYNYQYETSRKLGEFSDAFEKVGSIIKKHVGKVPIVNTVGMREIFTELTNSVCGACNNCNYCWGDRYYDTYHEALGMIECAESFGEIKTDTISEEFLDRCIHFDELVNETNRQLALSRFNADIYNRQMEMRMLMAEQMAEISKLVNRLKEDVLASDRVYINEEVQIRDMLKSHGIKATEINIYDKSENIREVYICAKTEHGCVSVKQIEDVLTEVMGRAYKALPSMTAVLARQLQMLVFVNDVRYKVLTGTARIAKDGETLSGDNFSFMRLSHGRMVMTITDGMGSGRSAFCESEAVIEMLEQLLEAGFGEEMALKFVNTTMVMSGDNEMFSTVDMCVIDMYSGMCDCIKCGAAATFIKKKNGVKIIDSDAMPIGIIPEMNCASTRYRLADGDYVIMISDGVSDSFDGVCKEEVICRLIEDAEAVNAVELAEYILESAKKCNMCRAGDDMSVIVAGVWDKY